MDNHHFDQIARTLATTPSRRRVLRLLVAATVGGAFVRRQETATATSCGVAFTPVPANVVTGSCQDLTRHRRTAGVTEADGTTHPEHTGWAAIKFAYSHGPYGWERIDAKKGLPGRGKFCIQTDPIRVTFSALPDIYRLDWRPSQAISEQCRQKVAEWTKQVEAHECRHVEDGRTVAAKTTISKSYKACGDTKAKAFEAIEGLVKDDAKKVTKEKMEPKYNRLRDAFHATDAGGPALDPDCSVCGCSGGSGVSALADASCGPCCQTCGAPGCSAPCNGQSTVCTFDGCCCHDFVVVRSDGLSGCKYTTAGKCGVKDHGCP